MQGHLGQPRSHQPGAPPRAPQPRFALHGKALILAFLLLFLTCFSAAALALHFSNHYDVQRQAMDALSKKYNLTNEMMNLFQFRLIDHEDGWTAVFTAVSPNPEAMGDYTVVCQDGEISCWWSHDGETPGLNVWSAAQLAAVLRLRRESAENWQRVSDYDSMTLEEKAALDAPLLDMPEAAAFIHIAPDENDLSPEAAIERSKEAVTQKYGIAADSLNCLSMNFLLNPYQNTRCYTICLKTGLYRFRVDIQSPAGVIDRCQQEFGSNQFLPEGDLAQYLEATREYIKSGAFDLLSARDKGLVAARYQAAGLGDLLPEGEYLVPASNDLSSDEALKAAQRILEDAYSLSGNWQSFFAVRTALLQENGRRVWRITYLPEETIDWHWYDEDKLGVYSAALDAATGETVDCQWSLAGVDENTYTESTFGQAEAYCGSMLPWIEKLRDEALAIVNRYPRYTNLDEFTLADHAAFAELMRSAGYSPKVYHALLPEASDISQDEALALALRAFQIEFGVDPDSLFQEEQSIGFGWYFWGDVEPFRAWSITLYGDLDQYAAILYAETGEVYGMWHDTPASGNG